MARISKEFLKLETRLLNDHRFFTLSEADQAFYIKILMVSRITKNKIPKNRETIKAYLRSDRDDIDIESTLNRLKEHFPKFKENKHFYYFEGFSERFGNYVPNGTRNLGTEEEEEEEEDYAGTIKEILDYLNNKSSKHYTPAAANSKFIRARLKDGYSPEDLKQVIDVMVSQWKGTDMDKYLRPETLFNATKFQTYIQFKYKKEYTRDEINKMRRGETI